MTRARTYGSAYAHGQTFAGFVEATVENRELWEVMSRRRFHVEEAATRIASVPGRWRLLVLADDWCGDAVNTLPVVARLAEAAGNVELRIVGRDEHPDLMDRHLTNGGRAIPVVVLLDESGKPHGWWGPRPRLLQQWFERTGRAMEPADRYRELRRWYARDRGATTASEIADLVACAASEGREYEGTRPCNESLAA